MKRIFLIVTALIMGGLPLTMQGQLAYWQKYLGGKGFDFGKRLLLNQDGTIIVGGEIEAAGTDESGKKRRDRDLVILKMATQDKVFWRQQLGGKKDEILNDLIAVRDGGYLAIGSTASSDLKGFKGDTDLWLVKIDEQGAVEWTRVYGGKGDDRGLCVIELTEGGFLIGGESGSRNGSMRSPHHGGFDSWVAKLNREGAIIWEKHFGGMGNEKAVRLHEDSTGRYVVVNTSDSRDQDVAVNFGRTDVWVFSLDDKAEITWQRNFGGEGNDDVRDSHLDENGHLTLAGTTFSRSGHVLEQKGYGDFWLFQLVVGGDLRWSQTYGGRKPDGVSGMTATYDGGFLLCGMVKSNDGDVEGNRGYFDGWIVKTNQEGEKEWTRTLGFEAQDELNDVIELEKGGYLMIGTVQELLGGTPLPGHQGAGDIWLTNMSDPRRLGVRPYVTPPILVGTVLDADTREPLEASITLTDNKTLDSLNNAFSEAQNGSFVMLLPTYGLVSINALRAGYMFYGQDLLTDTMLTESTKELTIELEPIEVGSSLILRLIYFNTGEWELLPASFAELERVVSFMKLNPRVHVEVTGHTDNTGNRAEKTQLSLFRAQAVQNYLVRHGIQKARIRVKGAGMSRPIADNFTPEGRQKNRRVEFVVIRK
jgi:flagellar motor protein MotB